MLAEIVVTALDAALLVNLVVAHVVEHRRASRELRESARWLEQMRWRERVERSQLRRRGRDRGPSRSA